MISGRQVGGQIDHLQKKFKKKYKFKNTSKEEAKREAELEVRQEAVLEVEEEMSGPHEARDRRQGLRLTQVLRTNKNSWKRLITKLMLTMLGITSLPIKTMGRECQDFILKGPGELATTMTGVVHDRHIHDLPRALAAPTAKDSGTNLTMTSEKATTGFHISKIQ